MKHLSYKAHLPFRRLSQIIRHPKVLDAVEDVVGPNIVCWGSSMFVKEPHDPLFVSWHADTYYYGFEPAETCTVWIAFTPSKDLSGCVRVLPGSHNLEMPVDEAPSEHNHLCRGQTTRGVDEAKAVPMHLSPGQFSMHHERVVHGSAPNNADWRRIGYSFHYCATNVRQVRYAADEPKPEAALVRGRDPNGNWVPEPMQDKEFNADALGELAATRMRLFSRGRR